MTCIAGVKHEGKVYIGADSSGVAGYDLTVMADEKVFRNGPFLMGFTTSFRMGQLLRFAFNPPKQHPDTDDYRFMVTEFIDECRRCLKTGGWAQKTNEQEEAGTFLVGYKGELYIVEGDYQVGRPAAYFAAVGCGAPIAHGALHATEGMAPERRIRTALEAAERFSAGVRRPFMILESG